MTLQARKLPRAALRGSVLAAWIMFQVSWAAYIPLESNRETPSHVRSPPSDAAGANTTAFSDSLSEPAVLSYSSRSHPATPSSFTTVDGASLDVEMKVLSSSHSQTSTGLPVPELVRAEVDDVNGSAATKDKQLDSCSLPEGVCSSVLALHGANVIVLDEVFAESAEDPHRASPSLTPVPLSHAWSGSELVVEFVSLAMSHSPAARGWESVIPPMSSVGLAAPTVTYAGAEISSDSPLMRQNDRPRMCQYLTGTRTFVTVVSLLLVGGVLASSTAYPTSVLTLSCVFLMALLLSAMYAYSRCRH